jgi:hypothetical protein
MSGAFIDNWAIQQGSTLKIRDNQVHFAQDYVWISSTIKDVFTKVIVCIYTTELPWCTWNLPERLCSDPTAFQGTGIWSLRGSFAAAAPRPGWHQGQEALHLLHLSEPCALCQVCPTETAWPPATCARAFIMSSEHQACDMRHLQHLHMRHLQACDKRHLQACDMRHLQGAFVNGDCMWKEHNSITRVKLQVMLLSHTSQASYHMEFCGNWFCGKWFQRFAARHINQRHGSISSLSSRNTQMLVRVSPVKQNALSMVHLQAWMKARWKQESTVWSSGKHDLSWPRRQR